MNFTKKLDFLTDRKIKKYSQSLKQVIFLYKVFLNISKILLEILYGKVFLGFSRCTYEKGFTLRSYSIWYSLCFIGINPESASMRRSDLKEHSKRKSRVDILSHMSSIFLIIFIWTLRGDHLGNNRSLTIVVASLIHETLRNIGCLRFEWYSERWSSALWIERQCLSLGKVLKSLKFYRDSKMWNLLRPSSEVDERNFIMKKRSREEMEYDPQDFLSMTKAKAKAIFYLYRRKS